MGFTVHGKAYETKLNLSFDEFASVNLFYVPEPWLEVVVLQGWVGKRHANAALAESRHRHVNVTQKIDDWRIDVTITLQLDNYELVGTVFLSRLEVVKADVEVYSQTLSLFVIHESDTVKVVLYHGVETVKLEACLTLHKFASTLRVAEVVLRRHLDTLFLGTSVVVLVLHLKERDV